MSKTSLTVEGSGTNPGKIMFYLGMLFVVLGVIIGGGGLIGAFAAPMPGFSLFGVLFLAIFCGVGGFFA